MILSKMSRFLVNAHYLHNIIQIIFMFFSNIFYDLVNSYYLHIMHVTSYLDKCPKHITKMNFVMVLLEKANGS